MAERFVQEAQAQLNPVYDQSIAAIQGQIPAIQQLYQTLMTGLEQSGQAQIKTGTQNIVEDASTRGVLRSTLPVDARQSLLGTVGAALTEGMAKLQGQQAGEIGAINEKVAGLNIDRTKGIQSLADTLYSRDLKEREFQYSKQLEQQKLEISRQAARSKEAAVNQGAPKGLVSSIYNFLGSKRGQDGFVSPNKFREAQQQWVNAGGAPSSFLETYGAFVNPAHQERFGGYY